MKIFLVGGGTGGHFYPLIAVAEALRAQVPAEELKLAYIGPDAFEQAELDRVGIRYVWCPAGKVRRYVSILNVTDLFKTLFGLFVAFFKLLAAYPDVILSKGGYTAVPIILAARILRIPVVIHESDARMGRANELAVGYAKYIAVSYPRSWAFLHAPRFVRATLTKRRCTSISALPMRRHRLSSCLAVRSVQKISISS